MDVPTSINAEGGASAARVLYSPGQIGLAALVGAPAAAGWFISRNEKQFGRSRSSQRWLWGCVAGLLLLIAVSILLPPTFPRTGLAVGYVAGFYAMAKQLYGAAVQEHRAAGGAQGSWWRVIWVSFLFLLGSFVLVIASVLLLPESFTARFIPPDQAP